MDADLQKVRIFWLYRTVGIAGTTHLVICLKFELKYNPNDKKMHTKCLRHALKIRPHELAVFMRIITALCIQYG